MCKKMVPHDLGHQQRFRPNGVPSRLKEQKKCANMAISQKCDFYCDKFHNEEMTPTIQDIFSEMLMFLMFFE